jgi:hypothetical protein
MIGVCPPPQDQTARERETIAWVRLAPLGKLVAQRWDRGGLRRAEGA